MGKLENCKELNILREFRDRYLSSSCAGRSLIDEYYALAPSLVVDLSVLPDAVEYWRNVYRNLVEGSVALIRQHRNHEAVMHYVVQIREAQDLRCSLRRRF